MTKAGDLFALMGSPLLFDQFGEEVTYFPAVGDSRAVTAIVVEEAERLVDGDYKVEVERLTINVLRDQADATHGGVERPQPGDRLKRDGDLDSNLYAFTGDTEPSSEDTWTLVFERPVSRRHGTAHRRGE